MCVCDVWRSFECIHNIRLHIYTHTLFQTWSTLFVHQAVGGGRGHDILPDHRPRENPDRGWRAGGARAKKPSVRDPPPASSPLLLLLCFPPLLTFSLSLTPSLSSFPLLGVEAGRVPAWLLQPLSRFLISMWAESGEAVCRFLFTLLSSSVF